MNNNINNNVNSNYNQESDTTYKIAAIFLILLIVVIISICLIRINFKSVERKIIVYEDKKSNLVLKNVKVNIVEKKAASCSKKADCSVIKPHKLKANIDGKIYLLDANKKKYQKIEGTKKYVYATINDGRIEVGVARDYAIDELFSEGVKTIGKKLNDFSERMKNWMREKTDWGRNE